MLRTTRLAAYAWIALGLAAPLGAQAQEKWTPLFDGKTLSGWTFLPLQAGAKTNWEVKDGTIVGTGDASMLFSPRGDYKNFRYRAELKISDKGNSGMYIRAPKKATFTQGYEVQVNATHTDPIRTGSLYTLVHIYKTPAPADTYFTQEIEASDIPYRGKTVTRIVVKINGEILYEYLDHDRLFASGHFAFQQHDPGSKVTIRKVEVIELP
ncbi:DUF1080 domain-containing protein [Isosphaeraceae bacterium EP7]